MTWPDLWFDLPLAVLDVETTGFDPQNDRIIEIGIVHFHQGEVIESWGQLVNPGRPIPEAVIKLTGIKDEDVADAPPFADVAAAVAARLEGKGIVAYNLPFDRGFIAAELERTGRAWPDDHPTFDPLIFARQFQRKEGSKKLGKVAERMGINLEEAHRAVDDATTAGHILCAFRDLLPRHLNALQMLQRQWARQQAQETSNWRGRRRMNTDDPWSSNENQAQTIGLGPAFVFGDEHDPLRALYRSLPEAPERSS